MLGRSLMISDLTDCGESFRRGRWKTVEAEMNDDEVVVFVGYTLGWLTRGAYCEYKWPTMF